MIYVSTTDRAQTEQYVRDMHVGLSGSKLLPYNEILTKTDATAIIHMGFLRGTNLLYWHALRKKIPLYYIDRPYWGESRKHPHYMKITKNAHVKSFIEDVKPDRYEKDFPHKILPYHKNGADILVIPPSYSVSVMFNAQDWLKETLTILKQNTDRNIIVREKPFNPRSFIDEEGRLMPGKSDSQTPNDAIDWTKVWAVVTYNSTITIKAIANGVPCFCNFDNPCLPIAEEDFSKIETPRYENREPLFWSLAYGQFTQEERRNGYVMERLDGR